MQEHAVYSQLSGVITSSYTLGGTIGSCTTRISNLASSTVRFDLLLSAGLTTNININNKPLTTPNSLLVAATSRSITISYSPEESHVGAFTVKLAGKNSFL